MATTTWRKEIEKKMKSHGETFADVISVAVACGSNDAEEYGAFVAKFGGEDGGARALDVPFDDGYGGPEGCHFTVWTRRRVYFPVVYDGAEWCASVPRDPCGEATEHVGG